VPSSTAGRGTIIGPVYAADLLGGCAGSLLAGLVAIPMLGLPATAALAAALALLALLLV
jgi:predicted membrane-bound spermidine synthase